MECRAEVQDLRSRVLVYELRDGVFGALSFDPGILPFALTRAPRNPKLLLKPNLPLKHGLLSLSICALLQPTQTPSITVCATEHFLLALYCATPRRGGPSTSSTAGRELQQLDSGSSFQLTQAHPRPHTLHSAAATQAMHTR